MNNDDTISRSALMERLMRKKCGPANVKYTAGWNDCIMRVRSMVHSALAVQPQVKHCEGCIYYHPDDQNGETCWNAGGMTEPDADDFCSRWAEKGGGSSRLTPRKRGQDDADN